jgi:hypothetical protein
MITVFDVLILLGLILIIFGCGFFILATIMERHYDRKLWELEQKQKGKKYERCIVGVTAHTVTKKERKIGLEVLKVVRY